MKPPWQRQPDDARSAPRAARVFVVNGGKSRNRTAKLLQTSGNGRQVTGLWRSLGDKRTEQRIEPASLCSSRLLHPSHLLCPCLSPHSECVTKRHATGDVHALTRGDQIAAEIRVLLAGVHPDRLENSAPVAG